MAAAQSSISPGSSSTGGRMATMRDSASGNKELISTTLGQGVEEEYEKLQAIVRETKEILTDLESRHLILNLQLGDHYHHDEELVVIMKRINELYYEADDVLDEFSFEAMKMVSNSFSMSNPFIFRHRMSRKIKDFRRVLDGLKGGIMKLPLPDEIDDDDDKIGAPPPPPPPRTAANMIGSEVKSGWDKIKTEIINKLIDPNNEDMLSVISVVGEWDFNRESLATQILWDASMTSHFDLRIPINVLGEFEVEEILQDIINRESSSGRSMPYAYVKTTWDNLWRMVKEIMSGKRFLIVLYEVRNVDGSIWDNFKTSLRSVGSKGSTVLVTTPSEGVASILGSSSSTYHLKLAGRISDEQSWQFLASMAFSGGGGDADADADADLVEIGKQIARLCRGESSALMIMGSFLREKRNKHEWMSALKTLYKSSSSVDQSSDGGDIFSSALRFSYNQLESPLKRCFAYCSVFPKDHIFKKNKLIQLWTAEGFLEEPSSSSNGDVISMEDMGVAYVNKLAMRSFLHVFPPTIDEHERCTMDPRTRDFALKTVLGNEVMTVKNVSDDEMEARIITHEPRYLSLSVGDHNHRDGDDTQSIPDKLMKMKMKMNKVRTCLELGHPPNNIISSTTTTGCCLISNFKSLRVLQLKHISKDQLLSSIGELMHLRYLDLSHGRFKALPVSISKLYHLQTLKLLHCRYLQRLPKEIIKLINLRHLEIDQRGLNIPRGLGKLHKLQTFTSFKVGNDVTTEVAGIEELGCLQQLRGRLSLFGLGNLKNEEKAKAANLKEKEYLWELTLEWESDWHDDWHDYNDEDKRKQNDLLEALKPHQNLVIFRILCFSGTKLPTWLSGRSHLSNIQTVEIYSCHHITSLDMTGLRSLRELTISNCENLEYARVLENLKLLFLLQFKGCDKLKSLVGAKGGANQKEQVLGFSSDSSVEDVQKMANLYSLQIESCDHLTTLPKEEMLLLQSLKILHIKNCANHMVFREGLENLLSLRYLHIENFSYLEALPKGIGKLSSLVHFEIRECPKLMSLLEEMQHWRSLQILSIFACANLRALPGGIAKIASLVELKIERCSNLMALPESLDKLSSLRELEISSCNSLTYLPQGMQHLKSLEKLKIQGCDNLQNLPEELGDPSTLRVLVIIGCHNLELLPEGLGNLKNLSLLEITDCSNLKVLPLSLANLSSLGSLYIQRCPNLTSFPNTLLLMTSLRVLRLSKCSKLRDLSGWLGHLSALEKLIIWGCDNLIELMSEGIQDMRSLQELSIFQCSKLETLPNGLEDLPLLKKLVIWNCPKLKSSKEAMEQLRRKKLSKLIIKDCSHLETIYNVS